MTTDIEIAQKSNIIPIDKIAQSIGLERDEYELYGKYTAKVDISAINKREQIKDGKLILVTTISPTRFGEGKTTTAIGLSQAFNKIGRKSIVCIREPSLGPTFGVKGGAAGGGYSQVIPMEDINLHFTGDMHTVGAAHNLLAAMIDNHLYYGNKLQFDIDKISWSRVIDMNDRALRDITLKYKNIERKSSFEITAASEIMAILCLSMNIPELKEKLNKVIAGYSATHIPITAKDLKASGAMALLLKEAIKPNLVQTLEGTPAFVHGGPFANIAHGCNSLISTKLALKLCEFTVVEAGFGSDLGAEKFFDIKCRIGNLNPQACVLVLTTKALKWHGFDNLEAHLSALSNFGIPIIAAINKYPADHDHEIELIIKKCREMGIKCAVSDVRAYGGSGGAGLANLIANEISNSENKLKFLYELNETIEKKIQRVSQKIYGAKDVIFSDSAQNDLDNINKLGFSNLPICIAKTQFSLSDDPKKLGRPLNFDLHINKLKACPGAGFIVVFTGDIMTIPGLPEHPAAENMDIDADGNIKGIF